MFMQIDLSDDIVALMMFADGDWVSEAQQVARTKNNITKNAFSHWGFTLSSMPIPMPLSRPLALGTQAGHPAQFNFPM